MFLKLFDYFLTSTSSFGICALCKKEQILHSAHIWCACICIVSVGVKWENMIAFCVLHNLLKQVFRSPGIWNQEKRCWSAYDANTMRMMMFMFARPRGVSSAHGPEQRRGRGDYIEQLEDTRPVSGAAARCRGIGDSYNRIDRIKWHCEFTALTICKDIGSANKSYQFYWRLCWHTFWNIE